MAGRPRSMARRVMQAYDRLAGVDAEIAALMPKQYTDATTDSLGQMWQQAVESLAAANDYLCDLVSCLNVKAEAAEQRAIAGAAQQEIPAAGDDSC